MFNSIQPAANLVSKEPLLDPLTHGVNSRKDTLMDSSGKIHSSKLTTHLSTGTCLDIQMMEVILHHMVLAGRDQVRWVLAIQKLQVSMVTTVNQCQMEHNKQILEIAGSCQLMLHLQKSQIESTNISGTESIVKMVSSDSNSGLKTGMFTLTLTIDSHVSSIPTRMLQTNITIDHGPPKDPYKMLGGYPLLRKLMLNLTRTTIELSVVGVTKP